MPTFIEVKVHAPTNTRGKRISCKASGKPRRVYPWAYEAGFRENLRAAAAWYAQDVLNATEYSVRVLGANHLIADPFALPSRRPRR